jgi:hypothetical protein
MRKRSLRVGRLFPVEPATEADFQRKVIAEAKNNGWMVMHAERSMVRNTNGSIRWVTNVPAGFPDLLLVKPPLVLFLELKKDRKSKPTDAQLSWVATLQACDQVEAYIVRPADAATIYDILRS